MLFITFSLNGLNRFTERMSGCQDVRATAAGKEKVLDGGSERIRALWACVISIVVLPDDGGSVLL